MSEISIYTTNSSGILASALLHGGALLLWLPEAGSGVAASGRGTPGSPVSELHLVLGGGASQRGDASGSPLAALAPPTSLETPPLAQREEEPSKLPEVPAAASEPPPPRESTLVEPHERLAAPAQSLPSVAAGASLPGVVAAGDARGAESIAGGAGAAGGVAAASYWSDVAGRIHAALRYPRRAQRAGVHGSALVAVRIDRAGQLLHCEIARSSGSGLLDRDACATVLRAAPFGEVPAALAEGDLEFEIPVFYDIASR